MNYQNNQGKGKIVQKIVKKSGHKLVAISKRLGMSRATLYKRFKEGKLTDRFLFALGEIIGYDFTEAFPNLKNSIHYRPAEKEPQEYHKGSPPQLDQIQKKYAQTLESYNKLLKFLVRLVNDNELHTIKEEIADFIKKYMQ